MRVDVRFQETAVQSMCASKYYHRVGEADQISEKKSGRKTVQGEDEATYRRRMPVLAGCGECEPRRRPLIIEYMEAGCDRPLSGPGTAVQKTFWMHDHRKTQTIQI